MILFAKVMRLNKFNYNPFFLFSSNNFYDTINNKIKVEPLIDNETFLLDNNTTFLIKNKNNIQLKISDLGYTNLYKNNFKKSFILINNNKFNLNTLGFNNINNDFKFDIVLSKIKETDLILNMSYFNAITGKYTILTRYSNPNIIIDSENIILTYD